MNREKEKNPDKKLINLNPYLQRLVQILPVLIMLYVRLTRKQVNPNVFVQRFAFMMVIPFVGQMVVTMRVNVNYEWHHVTRN